MSGVLTSVVIGAKAKHTATVVWLHGLGDSGAGWSFLAEELSPLFPFVKWILPNAPTKRITLNGGYPMPAWFDILGLDRSSLEHEDQKGMLESMAAVNRVIREEVDSGIPADRIVLGGFSQGCALSLLSGLTSEYKLAGIVGCSGWLVMADKIKSMVAEANKKTPILMCHGDADTVVQYKFGQESADHLKQMGYNLTFNTYPGMAHSACPKELIDISDFLKQRFAA
ncbi:Phospholipase/carboxylesterase/thioesterase [Radiomyces spectabilis]|uniref:Phospholipase/carboxylesterase/thioesterase n=1 Tax=Radiomyces spectabilis TaxID=64574 RepID=UPI00221E6D14|nr:Phospholipase/carboxylesterase/thioesterase [Radiomyces spectabilis]KAI8393972.1 Phospholipase/carboxylesterase/thioesterase [Radiomyces spectabilis]